MNGGRAEGGGAKPAGQGEVAEEDRLARVALSRILEPGDELAGGWVARYGPVETARALAGERPLPGAGARRWAGLRLRAAAVAPAADLAAVTALGGRFLCPGDAEWPGQLDDLGAVRPLGLWVRGASSLRFAALRSVALVGARACTEYGAHVASVLGSGLARRGWTVVSGAAYGVDGAAHRGALAVGGATVGVLACGVDVAYPPGNRELLARLGEQGWLLAELAPGEHPTRPRFVLRNRVIAALTRGTVVVEAQLRSGSLVTARWAERLGRQTMGVPGPVTSGLSAGVHRLLRTEGRLVTCADEVVELVGSIGELAPEPRSPLLPRDLLPAATARVLEALPAGRAVTVPWLARAAATAAEETRVRLTELRSLGFVECSRDRWQLTRPAGRHPNG
ncbi:MULTISPECIES: DNA-processing protein DprA [unclassified Streptomyces]|uniref:DNA-processing protein DprA n=1 Tax=unclassified Streptomyces TaxID=2593676 RepID=UPI0022B71465|nr:DNA-processing protein DprA [Streptomyces sp. WMMC1477]MCZ7433922.1 DNA-processing protein DprA [Streptomyces sp. WMMC1477]